MDGAGREQSAQLLRDLVQEARATEDEAWRVATELRKSGASGDELLAALQFLESATGNRTRLQQALRNLAKQR